jgi:serine/arginine repetitive matrix protein 1
MSLGSFFKGTSVDQNSKFTDKDKKIINSTKWSEVFDKKVDMSKVSCPTLTIGQYG